MSDRPTRLDLFRDVNEEMDGIRRLLRRDDGGGLTTDELRQLLRAWDALLVEEAPVLSLRVPLIPLRAWQRGHR